jgi:predicted metalloprotease with PDZ domain
MGAAAREAKDAALLRTHREGIMINAKRLSVLCAMLGFVYARPARTTSTVVGRGSPTASPTKVEYTLRVDSAASEIAVEMLIHSAPAEFRLAMSTHAEYDDQYWRYVSDLRGESARGAATVIREDSSLWRIGGAAGDVTIRYRVHFPTSAPMQQASWKGHLTPRGGLVGGPHSFLYLVGAELAPVRVTLVMPSGWTVATGLDSVAGSHTYTAPSAEALIDSPIMVGLFRSWRFDIDGVAHDIAYLGAPGGMPFDTTLFVANVERIAREAAHMFGRMPYGRYQFLFEDGTYGGLEHLNSVSIGTQSANLARDPNSYLAQIAHEYFHTWNEVHLRPAAWVGVRHVPPAPTGETVVQ